MSCGVADRDLEALLPPGPEPARVLAARLARLGERRRQSAAHSEALDRLVLERIAALHRRQAVLRQELTQIRAVHAELREVLEALTAPPWLPGVFLRRVETAAGPLAEVFQGRDRRLVRTAEGIDAGALVAGQVVYLAAEGNAVVGVACATLPESGEVATVERVLDDGRIVVQDRDAEILVHAAHAVREAGLAPGDGVRWSRELRLAFEPIETDGPGELFVSEVLTAEIPHALGGLASETEQVVSLFTQSIAHPETAACYGLSEGSTLLLHGPPGNGKTSLARIIASALAGATGQACRFAAVKGAQLESPWVGTTQRNVRELFRELNRDPRPAVLFIDEVDAIGRHRGGTGGHHSDKFLSAWLTEIDGLQRRRGSIGIVAATNRKDLIDQALLDRLSGMELFIGRPGLDAAREIFAVHLPVTLPYGPNGAEAGRTRQDIIDAAVGTLYSPNADNAVAVLRLRDGSARTVSAREVLSGRAIEQICAAARRAAFRRHAGGGRPGVRAEDMDEAVAAALARLASTLSRANAAALLDDLPPDPDVVAVEPVRRPVAAHRYLRSAPGARGDG